MSSDLGVPEISSVAFPEQASGIVYSIWLFRQASVNSAHPKCVQVIFFKLG